MKALELNRVSKSYGSVKALTDVSFAVERGEMFGLIGPDGAGKTTSIRIACGLLGADSGTVRVLGHDPVDQHHRITSLVGYLSQRFSLYGDLTIDENVAFFAEIHGVRDYRTARDRLLEMTQLTRFRQRRADRLSGGMKQKLALTCTLVHEPDVLILDEPTTGVDPVARREFWKLLSEFLARGLTIIMATPYLDEAERCGRVLLLHEGRVLAVDEPSALQSSLAGRLYEVVAATTRPPLDALRGVTGVVDAQGFGDRAHVTVADPGATPHGLQTPRPFADDVGEHIRSALTRQGIEVVSVRPIAASLEDVFIGMLGGRHARPGMRDADAESGVPDAESGRGVS
jgi:ABC-2 type transport system ATP-binding protein